MNPNVYRWCAVPLCNNTSIKTPNKLFIHVPTNKKVRNMWLNLARRDPAGISIKSIIYFCEDHFDLPKDMENYMQYHVMGSISQVRMKSGCYPTKFECQLDRRKRTCVTTERPYILKKQRKILIDDSIQNLARKSTSTMHEETAGTSAESSGGIHHQYPHSERHPETFKAWVSIVGGKLETPEDYEYYKRRVICDRHFSAKDKNRNSRLNCLAVPSLHLPGSAALETSIKREKDTIFDDDNDVDHGGDEDNLHATIKDEPIAVSSDPPQLFSWQKTAKIEDTAVIDLDDKDSQDKDVFWLPKQRKVVLYSNTDDDPLIKEETCSDDGKDTSKPIYKCRNCKNDIMNHRYTCVECVQYDMCGACEAAHNAHYVLRVPKGKHTSEEVKVLNIIRKELDICTSLLDQCNQLLEDDIAKVELVEEGVEDPLMMSPTIPLDMLAQDSTSQTKIDPDIEVQDTGQKQGKTDSINNKFKSKNSINKNENILENIISETRTLFSHQKRKVDVTEAQDIGQKQRKLDSNNKPLTCIKVNNEDDNGVDATFKTRESISKVAKSKTDVVEAQDKLLKKINVSSSDNKKVVDKKPETGAILSEKAKTKPDVIENQGTDENQANLDSMNKLLQSSNIIQRLLDDDNTSVIIDVRPIDKSSETIDQNLNLVRPKSKVVPLLIKPIDDLARTKQTNIVRKKPDAEPIVVLERMKQIVPKKIIGKAYKGPRIKKKNVEEANKSNTEGNL